MNRPHLAYWPGPLEVRPVVSDQDFPLQPSRQAVSISLFNYNLINGYSAMAILFFDELEYSV